MNSIKEVSLKGKRVLVRVDFNVHLDEKKSINDDSRMIAALPTIKKIITDGGMAIVLSHLGRPKNRYEQKFSLKHIVGHFSKLIGKTVSFSNDCLGEKTSRNVKNMRNGDILILENLRFYKQEVDGDVDFAKELSQLGDVYINDAIGTAHRDQASTSIIARFFPKNKYFGFLLEKELASLETVLKKPKRPLTAIIGGAKITGKIDVVRSLFDKVDNLIIGGGMAYTFAKAMGGEVGKSLVEHEKVELAMGLIKEAKKRGVNLLLPIDSINADVFSNNANTSTTNILVIKNDYIGLDIGKKSVDKFCSVILSSKTIVWNGPMGVFEMKSFESGTKKIGEAVCLATERGAFSLVGGGDSIAAVKKFNFEDRLSYVSTGGGAMLEYLEGRCLPGVSAILD